VLHVAEHLDVPLRGRNELLVAAGFTPEYGQTDLDAPEMAPVRDALDLVLRHAEPYPALVVDRHWDLGAGQRRARAAARRRRPGAARSRRSTSCG
jgi:hypothetical protein